MNEDTKEDAQRPILVLDDDQGFRELVTAILQVRGYDVIAARSFKDACTLVQNHDPALAIVDYRLPDQDGISWITWLREAGRNIPVIFVSGTWCDEKTFSWLRNILKVSLILKKPIVAGLFLQQIESILPPRPGQRSAVPFETAVYDTAYSEETSTLSPEEQLEEIAQALDAGIQDPGILAELQKKVMKLEIQIKLAAVKTDYLNGLGQEWMRLSKAVSKAQAEPENHIALEEAINAAHKIRGTSGSFGLAKVSDAAGKVEDMLGHFDPTDTLQEILWTEIFRALANGETAVNEQGSLSAGAAAGVAAAPVEILNGNLLIVGNLDRYNEIVPIIKKEIGVDVIICDSQAAAINRAKRSSFDAMLLDASADSRRVLSLAASLRSTQGNKIIPTAFVCPNTANIRPSELVYAGGSKIINDPSDRYSVIESLSIICGVQQDRKRKILTVDDDEVLTRFISTILTARGLSVRGLNKPIQILEAMNDFRPDLVLLDVMMPGLSGYDVCRMLRATEGYSAIPIIFLTSKSDRDGRAAAFQAGADDFLSKPVLAEELTTRVLSQLDLALTKSNTPSFDRALGIINRPEFIRRAHLLLDQMKELEQPVTFCFLSVDDFSNLSVMHGLYAAEQTISNLSDLISCHFKAEDLRAVWGEGGFILAFPNERKEVMSEAVTQMLEEFADIKVASTAVGAFKVTFSAGLADSFVDGRDLEGLINVANMRMVRGRQERFGAIAFSSF